jgi:uncharacterized membrane protein YoaK (UPF0700 family)
VTPGRGRVATALLLAAAAGTVDAVGYLVLHQIFTANMTGNTTKVGIAAGHANADAFVPIAVAIGCFVGSIGIATAGIEVAARRGVRSAAAPAFLAEAALLAALMIAGDHVVRGGTAPDHAAGFYLLLALAVVAMGVQTASFARVLGATVRTTYVSGVITTFTQELVNVLTPPPGRGRPSYLRDELGLGSRRGSIARLALHLGIWASFVGGAVWGGYAEHRWSTWPLALGVGALVAAAAVDLRQPVHLVGETSDAAA